MPDHLFQHDRYTWHFSNIFTFTWVHCTSLTRHGSSYLSSVINLIPASLYGNGESCHLWFAVLFLYMNPIFIVVHLGSFLYFWPGFKIAVAVNFCKTNHRFKPNTTCTWKHHSGLQFNLQFRVLCTDRVPTTRCYWMVGIPQFFVM